ncbi:hypothetical protein NESM_000169100 [Novymonas esmeraldas]|uniref:RING-type domain-containing protein n=1 Tax=Novymonas esmeraldas TaxID=1808958 RepID=A0AAW0F797_9TRYP
MPVCCGAPSAPLPRSLAAVEAELQSTHDVLVEAVQEEFACAICGSLFIDPRVLHCQHCFCLRCLYLTVARDRTSHITVPCAFQCTAATVTSGDIRALPKNHYVANACLLLRQHLVRRARLLAQRQLLCGGPAATPGQTGEPLGNSVRVEAGAAELPTAQPCVAAPSVLSKSESDAVRELQECEWCSCASTTCEVCPYCWSRVCAECRGRFSDHQYLCVEQHRPGSPPPKGASTGVHVGATPHTPRGEGGQHAGDWAAAAATNHARHPAEEAEAAAAATVMAAVGEDAVLPYLISPSYVPVLVKECIAAQLQPPLPLSEIDVAEVLPVRLTVPEVDVHCQHHSTGFGFDFRVYVPCRTVEGLEVDLTAPHWAEDDSKASATLVLLANNARLGETVLQELRRVSSVVSEVVLELSSAAHQAHVRRNKPFHLYALHVWMLARSQCVIARDSLLPTLERFRLLESIIGDVVAYQYQQAVGHAAPPQKHVIRERCVAFMRTELQLCRQLTQVMEGIEAACRGLHTLLTRMVVVLKELAQPRVHRGEEHRRARQSRARFSAQVFQSHQDDAPARESAAPRGRGGMSRLISRSTPPRSSAGAGVEDASRDADFTFRDQFAEHSGMSRTLTESMLSILGSFMQSRELEWTLCNTCIRECGLGEEDRRALLTAEERLQRLTDELLRRVWSDAAMTYILEVEQDAAGPSHSLDLLMDTETLELLDAALECPVYDGSAIAESLRSLSQLRASLVAPHSAAAIVARTADTQQQLLAIMTSVLSATMTHQTSALQHLNSVAAMHGDRYAAYLSTRQMDPTLCDVPEASAETLLANDLLKLLQRLDSAVPIHLAALVPKLRESGSGVDGRAPRRRAPGDAPITDPPSTSFFLLADFCRRDTALSCCLQFGDALVRAAGGPPLEPSSAPEGFAAHIASQGRRGGALASAPESAATDEDTANRSDLPLSAAATPPASADGDARRDGGVDVGVSEDEAAPHHERLFGTDTAPTDVAVVELLQASSADGDVVRKAAKIFKATFQLSTTSTSVGQQRLRSLPFYHGTCVYHGVSTPFYVDAQTGMVLMAPRRLSAAGRGVYALTVLSSPLFFVLLSAGLSVFLHRSYKLEVSYR